MKTKNLTLTEWADALMNGYAGKQSGNSSFIYKMDNSCGSFYRYDAKTNQKGDEFNLIYFVKRRKLLESDENIYNLIDSERKPIKIMSIEDIVNQIGE